LKDKISSLIRLQGCDTRIKDLHARKREAPLRINGLEKELNDRTMKFKEKHDNIEQYKKDRRKLEQEVQDLENKAGKSQIKLNSIRSNKEYTAALKEIDDLNREKSLKEDKILQLMEEIEELEKDWSESREEEERLRKRFESEKREIEKEMEGLNKELNLLEKQRAEYCKEVDNDLLKNYMFLKERKGGLAIGPVIGGVCQACFMGIPPQKYNELIKCNSLMTCPNCNRLIYWGEDELFIKVIGKSCEQGIGSNE